MKLIEQVEAEDGTRFEGDDAVAKCIKHEQLILACEQAMEPVGARPELSDGKWTQHSLENCREAKRRMLAVIRKAWPDATASYAILRMPDDDIHPMSVLGRIIDDSGVKPICHAWSRLTCINWNNFREYSQPYFAINPDQAERSE